MIYLHQWRVRVGAFHAVRSSSAPPRKGSRQAPLARSRPVGLLALLLLAGDIEANPGPPKLPRRQAALLSQRVFEEFFSRVSVSIQPFLDRFAGELLEQNLVAWEVVHDLAGALGVPPSKQSNKLLCSVQNKIDGAKSDRPFRSLCRVMKKFSVLEELAREMTERFQYLCLNDSALSESRSSDEGSPTPGKVTVATTVTPGPALSPVITVPSGTLKLATALSSSTPMVGVVIPGTAAPNGALDEDDLRRIINELNDISNVELLALNLGIRMSAWLKIEAEHPQQVEKQKTRVLYHWLKRMEIIEDKQCEDPTWARLAEAVAEIDPKLSKRIQCKYCRNPSN